MATQQHPYRHEINIDTLASWLSIKTTIGKQILHERLLTWNSEPDTLQKLGHRFQSLKACFSDHPDISQTLQNLFEELSAIEVELDAILTPSSALEEENYKELLFLRPCLKPFNFVPYALSFWAIFRVYILPSLSMLIPLFAVMLPYLIIRFVFKLPMTFDRYFNLLHSIVSGKIPDFIQRGGVTTSSSAASPQSRLKMLAQSGWVIATLVQSMLQPYWSYRHLKSVHDILRTKEKTLVRFHELYTSLQTTLKSVGIDFFRNPIPQTSTRREMIASILFHAPFYRQALRYIGGFEALYRLASHPSVQVVRWTDISITHPVIFIKDTYDYNVPEINRIPFTVSLGGKHHALLTGPNKGGKSTVLRATLINAILAHTYGCFIGTECTMTPFHRVYVCLKPDDLPGTLSRFEREVEFTSKTLHEPLENERTLVLIDELYHSTNPPDALTSCRAYCRKLWKKQNSLSIISTHMFDLVEEADTNLVEKLCCPATTTREGDIVFTYLLRRGICRVSSVGELLTRYGMNICARLT